MRKQYHILNGDSLRQQLPEYIQGDIIVSRECFVDGNVKGKDLADLFAMRAKFLSQNYGGSEQDYYRKVVPEFKKIKKIPNDSDINLWFEDDLFCQVNFWFVAHLLTNSTGINTVYLIRPESHNQYGFGGLNHSELNSRYKNRILLKQLDKIGNLWNSYQNDDTEKLILGAQELESVYPFILRAAEAHIARKPTNENPGRPSQSLIAIMNQFKTEDFDTVFREFSKREPIYGFGDLQVKRLLDQILSNH